MSELDQRRVTPAKPPTPEPVVWPLLGRRAGDNAQILALANGLGCHVETKRLGFNRLSALPNVILGASLLSVSRASRALLRPPWPDAVVTAGRRSVPAARWIRAQSQGATRLIHIGRPWAPLSWFDLVVSTPQYMLLERPNVLHNLMPLCRPAAHDSDREAARWRERLATLPRPWIAVLVGGTSRPHLLDAAAAEELGRRAEAAAEGAGGSLLVTFGHRASPVAAAAFESAISRPAYIHNVRSHGSSDENPYPAYLVLADRLIVTSDSAQMLADAVRTGKPVEVFSIRKQLDVRSAVGLRVAKLANRQGPLGAMCRLLIDLGITTSVRDLDRYRDELRRAGMLQAGDAAAKRQAAELAQAVSRARALIASRGQLAR